MPAIYQRAQPGIGRYFEETLTNFVNCSPNGGLVDCLRSLDDFGPEGAPHRFRVKVGEASNSIETVLDYNGDSGGFSQNGLEQAKAFFESRGFKRDGSTYIKKDYTVRIEEQGISIRREQDDALADTTVRHYIRTCGALFELLAGGNGQQTKLSYNGRAVSYSQAATLVQQEVVEQPGRLELLYATGIKITIERMQARGKNYVKAQIIHDLDLTAVEAYNESQDSERSWFDEANALAMRNLLEITEGLEAREIAQLIRRTEACITDYLAFKKSPSQ